MFLKIVDKIITFLKIPVLFILFAYLALCAFSNLSEIDYLFHIKSGEYITAHKAIPGEDVFSFTMENKQWTNHEWLYQVVIYWIYNNFGLDGVFLLKAAVFSLSFLILVFIALRIDWVMSFFLIFYGLRISFSRFTLRPDNLSFLFFIIFLLPFVFRKRKLLYLLPFIQLIWVNVHGFFFLGPLILLLYVVLARIKKSILDESFYRVCVITLFLTIVACFLNPHPLSTITYPLEILRDIFSGAHSIFYEYIQELRSPFERYPLTSLYFIYVALTSASLIFLTKFLGKTYL